MKKTLLAIIIALIVVALTATVVVMAHEDNSLARSYHCSFCGGTQVDECCSDLYGNDSVRYRCNTHNNCTKLEYSNTRVIACRDCGQPYSITMHLHAIYHTNGVVEDVCAYN